MKLYAARGHRGTVTDLDTGRPVGGIIWADIEQGTLEAYRLDGDGKPVRDASGRRLTYVAQGRFSYRPHDTVTRKSPKQSATHCVKCRSPLTLAGDELCPLCNARDRGYKTLTRPERVVPLLGRHCQHKGCSRTANWAVSDEVPVSCQKHKHASNGRTPGTSSLFFSRGMTVRRRYFCDFHFQPPRILDAKGEVVEELEEAHGVRPQ